MINGNKPHKGVNLGGWLVLEKWMTPSLFGPGIDDEYSLCKKLNSQKLSLLKKHRDTFITEQDFIWIKDNDFSAVRIPIGYWAIQDQEPYVSTKKYIDFAFKMCKKYNLKIILQLHAAPGSQNGEIHSGRRGKVQWSYQTNVNKTKSVLRDIANRYGKNQVLIGIGLLNEPSKSIPSKVLIKFYKDSIKSLTPLLHNNVKLIISDQFRPIRSSFHLPSGNNILLDSHFYHLMSDTDKKRGIIWHTSKLLWHYLSLLIISSRHASIVGEYTVNLPDSIQKHASFFNKSQQKVYSKNQGNFIWNYKTENFDHWSVRSDKMT